MVNFSPLTFKIITATCCLNGTFYPSLNKCLLQTSGVPCLQLPNSNLPNTLRWNLLNRTPSGPAILSLVERLSSFRGDFLWSVYTRVLLACPLWGGLSSFIYRRFHCIIYQTPPSSLPPVVPDRPSLTLVMMRQSQCLSCILKQPEPRASSGTPGETPSWWPTRLTYYVVLYIQTRSLGIIFCLYHLCCILVCVCVYIYTTVLVGVKRLLCTF